LVKAVQLPLVFENGALPQIGLPYPMTAFFRPPAPPLPEDPAHKLRVHFLQTALGHGGPASALGMAVPLPGPIEAGDAAKLHPDVLVRQRHAAVIGQGSVIAVDDPGIMDVQILLYQPLLFPRTRSVQPGGQ